MKTTARYFRKVRWSGALILLLFCTTVAGAETLEEAWQVALAHDNRLKAAQESAAAADESLSSAAANRLPVLKGQAAYSQLNQTPETAITIPPFPSMTIPLLKDDTVFASQMQLSVPLFTSGRISKGIASARAAAEAYRQEVEQVRQQVKFEVAEAFVRVLRAKALVEVAGSHVDSLLAHRQDVLRMDREGLVSRNDVLSVEVALADAKQSLLQAENGLSLAASAYNRLLGRPFDHPVALEWTAQDAFEQSENEEVLRSAAVSRRPELKGLFHQAEAYGARADSIRAEALPQLAAQGSWLHFDQVPLTDNDIWQAGLLLEWNMFDSGVIRHRAAAEERKARMIDHRREDVRTLIELQVRQALLDVQQSVQRKVVSERALEQAEENLKVARNRYVQEIGTHTEVLDAETLRIRSRSNEVQARYDLMLARIRLKYVVGDL
uniref:TolC family protein n=1 Tax=Desulfatirhabdium butyrativorans TaxID=340467 RepID=A0A7C4RT51_9BACT